MSPNSPHSAFYHAGSVDGKYSRSLILSIGLHIAALLLAIFGPYLLPYREIRLGTGIGGGTGGDISTVGVVDELSGGAGMVKPSLVPKPPVLEEKPPEAKSEAIPLPDTRERRIKKIPKAWETAKSEPAKNIVPTPLEKGSGGSGGASGGSGGGVGGGVGVSIGTGSGGLEGHYYAVTVERRISKNWVHPPEGVHVDIVYSFYVDAYGRIQGIQKDRSSGNPEMDFMAERAIRAVKDLPPPPPEFQGRLIRFSVHFVYPPGSEADAPIQGVQ